MHTAFRDNHLTHGDRLEWNTIAKRDSISNVVEMEFTFQRVCQTIGSVTIEQRWIYVSVGSFSVQILRDRCTAALRRISIASTRCSWPSCILDRGSVFVRAALLGLGTALQVCPFSDKWFTDSCTIRWILLNEIWQSTSSYIYLNTSMNNIVNLYERKTRVQSAFCNLFLFINVNWYVIVEKSSDLLNLYVYDSLNAFFLFLRFFF